jgi:alkyl hydroperoxide reductase subunit AhpC
VGLSELSVVAEMIPELTKRRCKVCALSADPVDDDKEWSKDILAFRVLGVLQGTTALPFPVMVDPDRSIAHRLGILDGVAEDSQGEPLPARGIFIVAPDGTLRFR